LGWERATIYRMTGLSHQMIALVAALWVLTLYPFSVGPVVGTLALIAVMVGALTPDLDQPTANLWRRLIGARTVGNIFEVFSGGHRHLTHSVVGIIGIGLLLRWLIAHVLNPDLAAPAQAVWNAYMIGYISHPIADTLTDRGVPWLWPLPWNVKIPPGPPIVRVTTESFVERILVRGAVIIMALLLLSRSWPLVLNFFR
jgi:membrane-bound metal-dependent hydrolase YbcI (DUF457 family)